MKMYLKKNGFPIEHFEFYKKSLTLLYNKLLELRITGGSLRITNTDNDYSPYFLCSSDEGWFLLEFWEFEDNEPYHITLAPPNEYDLIEKVPIQGNFYLKSHLSKDIDWVYEKLSNFIINEAKVD